MVRIAGAVLAAGSGTRMGEPKAELVVAGSRLLDRAVTALADGGCNPVLAVVRAGVTVAGATVVINPDPERGMRSSLALAIDAAGPVDASGSPDAVAVLLVDLPGVSATTVAGVLAAWRPGRIAAAASAGRRGHPIVMSPALWRDALALAGPEDGARALLAARPELVDEVAVDGCTDDLDTPADLARWRDVQAAAMTASLYDWAGGSPAFGRLINAFYDRVEHDELLTGFFPDGVGRAHREHVTAWWVEVFGGPAEYTAKLGGYEAMLGHHRGLAITAEQRLRFAELMSRAADDAGLPADPEFRAALVGYLEWGTRIAMHNSQPDAQVVAHAPVPRWGWGVAPPYQP